MVSGSISPPYSGYFSPFPHGTGSLSVSQEYLALPDGAGSFRRDFTGPALLRIPTCSSIRYLYGTFTPYGPAFQKCSTSYCYPLCRSYNPDAAVTALVWAIPRSLATTCGITVVFSSSRYLDVSVPWVCFRHWRMSCLQHDGLSHSEICGSHRICQSPQLIAAYHVLLRL